MNINNTTLEPIAAMEHFPSAQETARPFVAEENRETKCARTAAGGISRAAKWLLLPVSICASVLLVKVALVAGDLFAFFDALYANMPT